MLRDLCPPILTFVNKNSHFQLELETTMRQECEAKLTLTSTNYEAKITSLEKELEVVSLGLKWVISGRLACRVCSRNGSIRPLWDILGGLISQKGRRRYFKFLWTSSDLKIYYRYRINILRLIIIIIIIIMIIIIIIVIIIIIIIIIMKVTIS